MSTQGEIRPLTKSRSWKSNRKDEEILPINQLGFPLLGRGFPLFLIIYVIVQTLFLWSIS